MSTAMKEVVWTERQFSAGSYICKVERDEDRASKLSVTLIGHFNDYLIHEEVVVLTTDPSGGPDLSDIAKWKKICEKVVDDPNQRSCGIRG